MKILIIGGGGREHALAWRLAQSPECKQIFACPGNPGIAQCATCLPSPLDLADMVSLAEAHAIDLTIVGPEAPLVAGIVDRFRARGLRIIGPTQAAAQLEGSKIFAKQFFEEFAIPTARSVQTASVEEAHRALASFSYPLVIKADGLHAGKGVVIAQTEEEAKQAIGKLGPSLVIEEFLEGEEVSFIGMTDGQNFTPFTPAQDHKRLLDGDLGPNTGGMGAYSDDRILTAAQIGTIIERIIQPTLDGMTRRRTPFTGILYAGLMMTNAGPKILEYNVRFGDPETQAILNSFQGDLLSAFLDNHFSSQNAANPSVALTLASRNYPETPQTGDIISGIEHAEATGAKVFQAGTKLTDGQPVTNGGRVLTVAATAPTLQHAIANAYHAASEIHFNGMQYRRDIGQKGLKRW